MSGRKSVSVVAAATLVALTLPSSGAPPTADEIFQTLGYSAAERERLQRGEIVSHAVGELSDEELALTMAVIAPAPLERLLDLATSDQIIRANRDIIAFGRLKSSDEASFASVGFDASEGAEVRALIEAAPGSKLNLGDGEIARFAELRRRFPAVPCDRDPACTAAVTQEYRAVLAGRLGAYRGRGLAGIPPYSREGGRRSDAGAALRAAAAAMTLTARHLPREYDAYVRYPQGDQSSLEHEFLWIKQRVQDRPTFVLSHRVRCLQGGMAFVAERQFYVGQSYNALQILVAFVPAGDRTIVAYLNRTSTDQVAGFMKGTRHTMGRQIMEKEIRKEFEACLARLSPGAAPR